MRGNLIVGCDAAAGFGGGADVTDTDDLFQDGNRIQGNSSGDFGGGARQQGVRVLRASGDEYVGNTSTKGAGGLYVFQCNDVTLRELQFRVNDAPQAGGLFIDECRRVVMLGDLNLFRANESTSPAVAEIPGGGGGLKVLKSEVLISKGFFDQNSSKTNGGAAAIIQSNVTFIQCNFALNSADGGGGGIWAGANAKEESAIDVSICTFADNSAKGKGGAIFFGNGDMSVGSSVFSRNTATEDGGALRLQNRGLDTRRNATRSFIVDCRFDENKSSADGGAISNNQFATSEVLRCRFDRNEASAKGGALHISCASTITLSQSNVFRDNRAGGNDFPEGGGAIYSRNSDLDVSGETTLERNSAHVGGGCLVFATSNEPGLFKDCIIGIVFRMRNATFVDNVARSNGGGLALVVGAMTPAEDPTDVKRPSGDLRLSTFENCRVTPASGAPPAESAGGVLLTNLNRAKEPTVFTRCTVRNCAPNGVVLRGQAAGERKTVLSYHEIRECPAGLLVRDASAELVGGELGGAIRFNTNYGARFINSPDSRIRHMLFERGDNVQVSLESLSFCKIRETDLLGGGVTPVGLFLSANSSGTINQCNIRDHTGAGVNRTAPVGAAVATVDAENCWWGNATGPTNAGNPGGTGDSVVGDVDFTPFRNTAVP